MKRASLLTAALVAGSLALAGAGSSANPYDALLAAAVSAPANVSYTGVVEELRIGGHSSEVSVYRIEHRAPNLTRRLYTSPSGLLGDAIVTRGDLIFSIDAKRRRTVETQNKAVDGPLALGADFVLLDRNYRMIRKGDEVFDGRRTIDLVLINRYTGRPTVVVRIDAASKLMLDKEEFASDGALVDELRFEEVRFTSSVPAADFALPQAYAVVQGPLVEEPSGHPDRIVKSAGFAAWEPRALPDGFAPVEGNVEELHGVRTVQLLYTDGIRTFSLFENAKPSTVDLTRLQPQAVRIGEGTARYADDGEASLLAWSDGNLCYTLVGELGLVDLQRIAQAIER